jgi:hypothetical protein
MCVLIFCTYLSKKLFILRRTERDIMKYLYRFWLMTNLTHSFLMYLFHASTCFEQQVLIIRRAELY